MDDAGLLGNMPHHLELVYTLFQKSRPVTASQQTPAADKPPSRSLYLTTENDYNDHPGLFQCVQLELNAAVQL